jgi:hypothetical protein
MLENILSSVLTALSIAVVLGYLSRATHKKVAGDIGGRYLLRMHKFYFISGIAALLLAAVFVAAPFVTRSDDAVFYLLAFLMLLLCGGLGLLSLLYYKRHYVLFDETGFEVCNIRGTVKTATWEEIQEARFNSNSGLLTLTIYAGSRIKVHYHLVGFPQFVALLEQKTNWTSEQLRLPTSRKPGS